MLILTHSCIFGPRFFFCCFSLFLFCPHIYTFLIWVILSFLFDSFTILWPPIHVILICISWSLFLPTAPLCARLIFLLLAPLPQNTHFKGVKLCFCMRSTIRFYTGISLHLITLCKLKLNTI